MKKQLSNSFQNLENKAAVERFFFKNFPDSIDVIPELTEDFFKNPTSTLATMKCFPWTYEDKIALIGDACHAIVPFYGQGMNCGFEDCVVLDGLIEKHKENWPEILKEYEALRKPVVRCAISV